MLKKIQSKRLIIRKIQKSDCAVLYEAVRNPNFPEDVPLKEIIQTTHDAEQWVNTSIQGWDASQKYTWTICLKQYDNTPIGQILIYERIEDDKWHTAFWISNKYQSAGYASEALSALTETLSFKFWAGAATWNEASNRVLISCGFKNIDKIENGYVCRGKKIPIYEYEKV